MFRWKLRGVNVLQRYGFLRGLREAHQVVVKRRRRRHVLLNGSAALRQRFNELRANEF
tara:strand:+ start:273 stop:446 length:174 start_codon:yes stop_codon:yes gene_type:complete